MIELMIAAIPTDDSQASCESASWCALSPAHDGDWMVPTGRMDGEFNCPVVEIYCTGHIALFFANWSALRGAV